MEEVFIKANDARLLLQRYRSGETTPAENQLVETWYQRLLDSGEWQWEEGEKEALGDAIKMQLLQKIESRPVVHRIHFLKTSWFRYAAAIIIIAGATGIWYIQSNKSVQSVSSVSKTEDIAPGTNKAVLTLADGSKIVLDEAANGNLAQQGNASIVKQANGQISYRLQGIAEGKILMNRMATPRGGQYQLTLPDGSRVWLNAESSIIYPAAFVGSERNVEVTGEVYMEIAKNSKQPFIVKANGTEINVLGTSFNVNAYEDEESQKTTLIEGSVKVLTKDKDVLLKPGEQAAVISGRVSVINNADIEQALAWKNGSFYFNRTDIRSVMRQLARWYNVDVVYEQGIIPNVRFGGEMQRDLNLSQVLKILEKIGVHFTIEGKKIIVKP